LKNGCLKRVEVKTGAFPLRPKSKTIISMRKKADILALVVNKIIYYHPEFKEKQDIGK
jgi:chromosome condensin MukBEF MukE localization factor